MPITLKLIDAHSVSLVATVFQMAPLCFAAKWRSLYAKNTHCLLLLDF